MTKTNALIESKCQYHFRVHVVLDHKEPEPMLKMVYKETKLSVVSQNTLYTTTLCPTFFETDGMCKLCSLKRQMLGIENGQ